MLYVSNISPAPSKNEIRRFFEDFAEVRTLIWLTRKFAGYFIGQVLIDFVNQAENDRALTELNGAVLYGRKLRVKISQDRNKISNKENL